ncbi:acetylglutamate kinase [Aliidiomarina indica]|uniref:acetylglutamate kinase n=1 Tax=Aliidiomarina indica TaxID=2749147 RepID=UPI00188F3130|nr:acetylglutamate kinase [Aliidiomarina indica]
MTHAISVIKVGGAILDNQDSLQALLVALYQAQLPFVLVHGGGSLTDHMLLQAGFSSEKKDGQRITPESQINVVTGALAGAANKQIVAVAQQAGFSALGLSLADGPLLYVQQNPALGRVGEPIADTTEGIGGHILPLLLRQGILPVVSSIGIDHQGQLLNVNADYAAAALANQLSARLILLSDVDAIRDATGTPLAVLEFHQARDLLSENFIVGGMKVKLAAALHAAERSRRMTAITGWGNPESVIALLQGEMRGTCILPAV